MGIKAANGKRLRSICGSGGFALPGGCTHTETCTAGARRVEYHGADGERALKSVMAGGATSDTYYFNKMFQARYIGQFHDYVESKHIYVGEERIVTKQRSEGNANLAEEQKHQYYYHGDHLGSAQLVTNYAGDIYEHLEYTPYGELWVDRFAGSGENPNPTPFRFTGKEYDEETKLYYYGARYLDPRTSRWMSADPAMGEYIPMAPINDEAKKYNENLPGMGGIFNVVNMHAYHYAGNNPIVMVDPNGRDHRVGGFKIMNLFKQYPRQPVPDLPNSAWKTFYQNKLDRGIGIGRVPDYREIPIDTNMMLKIGDVFQTPQDTSGISANGNKFAPTGSEASQAIAGIANALDFVASILTKAAQTAPDGSHVGNLTLWYDRDSQGKVSRWGISLTLRDENGVVRTSNYTQSEAMDLLKNLRESNNAKHNKIYEKIQKLFD